MLLEDKQFIANVATMEALGYIQKTIQTTPKIQLSKQDIETIEEREKIVIVVQLMLLH